MSIKTIVAPYSLKECIYRIKGINDEDILGSNRLRFWQVDEHTVDYEVRVWRFLNFLGTVSGDLVDQNQQTTLVTIQTQLAIRLKAMVVIYTLLAVLITLSFLLSGKFTVGIFFVPWGIFCWLFWSWMCNRVAKSIQKRLQ